MYSFSKFEKPTSPTSKLIAITISIFLSLSLIISAVKFTLNFSPLYKFDINHLKINELANMDTRDILNNYQTLISYLKTSYRGELNFPTLTMSIEGRIHFADVKNIFVTLDYVLYATLIFGIVGIIYSLRKREFAFLKLSSFFLIVLPVALAIPFAINFNASFTAFHKLFFRNDYWEFDPIKDPVINMLPEEFFFHCAVLILVILAVESIILYLLYRRNKKLSNRLW